MSKDLASSRYDLYDFGGPYFQCICPKHGATTFLHLDREKDDFCLLPYDKAPAPVSSKLNQPRRTDMDPRGNIYEDENVPPEDAARLDGYLKARSEADKAKHDELLQDIKRAAHDVKVREMERDA